MTGSDFAGEFNSENEKDECRQGLRQVVVFEIGDQPFAVNVESVREIIRWQGVREIPQTPRSLMGVSTIRGEVLPVIDLAAFFEIQDSIPAEQKILIVLEMGENGLRTGVAVDSVKRIFSITTEQMDSTLKGAFIGENLHCVVKHGEINVLMPDFERIINAFKLEVLRLNREAVAGVSCEGYLDENNGGGKSEGKDGSAQDLTQTGDNNAPNEAKRKDSKRNKNTSAAGGNEKKTRTKKKPDPKTSKNKR